MKKGLLIGPLDLAACQQREYLKFILFPECHNSFVPNTPFLYPLKTENRKVSGCFQVARVVNLKLVFTD